MRIEEYTDQELFDELSRRIQLKNIKKETVPSQACQECEWWNGERCEAVFCKYPYGKEEKRLCQ